LLPQTGGTDHERRARSQQSHAGHHDLTRIWQWWGEIASRLARRLGWHVIDHAIVERVASELGTSQEEAEAHDESTGGIISQLLGVMHNLYLVDTQCHTALV